MANGLMHIVTAGVNHKTAPVEVRERLAFSEARLPDALAALLERPAVDEAAILSTCNRAELYAVSQEPEVASVELSRFFGEFHELPPEQVESHLYSHTDEPAARHLFRVAAGIDSMVLGEGEILRQVKSAYECASEAGTSRTFLNELFQRSLHIGKRARSETGIHRGTVSIASAAVDLALNVFGDLRGRQVMIIGAGEMSTLTLKHLVSHGVQSVVVANRTHQRAVELADEYGGSAITFDDFPMQLEKADIIVSSSAAPHAIVTVDKVQPRLSARRGRPLFIIDIAVPRDVDPQVAGLPNVYLFDIDDLEAVTEGYRREREKEVARVEGIIEVETGKFMEWVRSRGAAPVIAELRQWAESLRDEETEHWLRRMPELSEADQEMVRQMMRSFTNKLLHPPVANLRKMSEGADHPAHISFVRRLFGMDERGRRS